MILRRLTVLAHLLAPARRAGLRPGVRGKQPYDFAADPAEQRDRAAEKPDVVERMSRLLLDEAKRTLIQPAP